ncbi:polysaccharide deacetylase family protein [Minwuia sp.]|uniref:polysaccharide deacetylase family protein n=1 Tax=Minwuia sp. TaxID=2493630 RepID=UPI003A9262D7
MSPMYRFFSILCLLAVLAGWSNVVLATDVPRRIIAIHHPQGEKPKLHDLHKMAEMPLNWLGYVLDYRELDEGLPEEAIGDPDVAGVITWFAEGSMADPLAYVDWATRMVDAGKKFIILGDFGFLAQTGGESVAGRASVTAFLEKLGIELGGDWTDVTFDTEIVHRDPDFYDHERRMDGHLPPYELYLPAGDATEVMLKVRNRQSGDESALFMISPTAAFIEGGWIYYKDPVYFRTQWYVDPFRLFERVFGAVPRPVPDVTTLSGRRMYFSHIDGDGWRNVSLVSGYKKQQAYSARVVMEKAIIPYPDLPITVGPIAADLDPAWSGDRKAQVLASEIFALPQVEMAHHTYSHPFEWAFFEDYTPEKEAPFVKLYDNPSIEAWGVENVKGPREQLVTLKDAYDQPRGFGTFPFRLDREFGAAADFVNQFAPPDKKVEIVLWSGDTSPTEKMIRASREAGLLNLNGGDSRFDPEFPSVSYVPAVGFKAGDERQIYAANSNENTYTDLWSGRYFGYRDLVHTLRNTETPRRLKPINIYYHMYSGERTNALNGLLSNLDFARTQEIAPVTTSHYARMAQGFYSTRFEALGASRWRVLDRGALQTLRFDRAEERAVDMDRSEGVLGFRHHLNSLYVALDAAVEQPVVALGPLSARPGIPWLVSARWGVRDLRRSKTELAFLARGFGAGEMRWAGMAPGRWQAEVSGPDAEIQRASAQAGPDGILQIVLPGDAIDPVRVRLFRVGRS